MKKIFLLVVLALVGVAAWYFFETRKKPDVETPQQQPIAVSQYSTAFNQSIGNTMEHYYALSEAFVNWDSAAVTTHAADLKGSVDRIAFAEIQKDTLIYQTALTYKEPAQKSIDIISGNTTLDKKRLAFNSLSQNMYDLMRTIKYDNGTIYVQQCPMAFNDTETGTWLSKTEGIRNPYLGKHHPKYKAGMLECGETKETINSTAKN